MRRISRKRALFMKAKGLKLSGYFVLWNTKCISYIHKSQAVRHASITDF